MFYYDDALSYLGDEERRILNEIDREEKVIETCCFRSDVDVDQQYQDYRDGVLV
jgi:hypothetical protein